MNFEIGSKVIFMAEDRFSDKKRIEIIGWVFDIVDNQIFIEGHYDGEIYNVKAEDILQNISE